MTIAPLTYIIVLNWNGWQDTMECVESCSKLTYPNFQILIVDNGSTDGSVMQLHERFPAIELLQTGKNLGFAGGNNVGIRHALEQGADYIWLLNNDTIVDPSALSELVHIAQLDDNVGIVGSKIFYYGKPDVIWFAGGWIRYSTGNCGHIGQQEKDKDRFEKVTEADYITGCSLLIKSNVINKVGLMDERFFLYYEDADWNLRVKEHKFKIYYVPSSKVWHKVSMAVGMGSPAAQYYLTRNSLLFTLKHKLIFLPTATAQRLLDVVYFIFNKRFNVARSALRGLVDFYFFRFGEMRSRYP
jgi:GT2 family glycosyltransferase